ncbi:hypothetical protein [Streptomyces sp. NPDC090131]|uniref:hypothetical protein n=1 Tax=Streptomyces sp. NPDC090131 TaxID=3365954 RepID=UPI0037FBFBFB
MAQSIAHGDPQGQEGPSEAVPLIVAFFLGLLVGVTYVASPDVFLDSVSRIADSVREAAIQWLVGLLLTAATTWIVARWRRRR